MLEIMLPLDVDPTGEAILFVSGLQVKRATCGVRADSRGQLEVSRRPTRFELLCWELNIEESRARPAWDVALRIKLLKAAGTDRHTGAQLFALTDCGRHALLELSGRRRKHRNK
jgi:hypothetical protein